MTETGNEPIQEWQDVARWRKAERERLITSRLALPASLREQHARKLSNDIESALGSLDGLMISLYWPFRGEPDLRFWISHLVDRGATPALPVVTEKATPLTFRAYRPGDPLVKGVWNIPVPAEGSVVIPNVVIAPVVGVDSQNYRLGYGGGYFDRTLASLPQKPLAIGIGYELQRIATIHPQPHDIAMDRVILA